MNMVAFQKNTIEENVIYLNESENVTHANVSKVIPTYAIFT